ncbi:MAG: hypothetical protein EBY03_08185, partial [Actinobacteria bacterium]|nr:hypothetical protein [Actinomycetota bacterium]
MANLRPDNFVGFRPNDARLLGTGALQNFQPSQFGALPPMAMAGFDRNQINNLNPAAMAGMNPAQLRALPPEAMQGFKPDQLAQLSPKHLPRESAPTSLKVLLEMSGRSITKVVQPDICLGIFPRMRRLHSSSD